MNETSEHLFVTLNAASWRPLSLQSRRQELLWLPWRVLLLVGIVFLHVLLLNMLATNENSASDGAALVVDFIDATSQSPLQVLSTPSPQSREAAKTTKSKRNPIAPAATSILPNSTIPPPPHGSEQPLQLYNSEGRLRVPDDMLEQLDKKVGDQRVFSYQIPHIDDARKYFDRKQPLVYEATQFEQYWTPDQDMLKELLTKLMEKTTKEIKIPIPNHPASTMVCSVSLLALGGSCGILTNGANYVGPLDDPNTLSTEEDRQCQAWWNQIIDAKSQDIWRKTRSLYEAQCRKPLAQSR